MCVRIVSYNILVNQDIVGPIFSERGLHQRDPLSPYLFILCTEGLSAILNYETELENLHGFSFGAFWAFYFSLNVCR